MTLHRATASDAGALGAVLSDWIDEAPWMPRLHTRAEDRQFVAGLIARGEVWTDDARRGFLARHEDEIDALYVARAARGRGLGTQLLLAMKATHARLHLWTFQSNEGAIRFYIREGFREASRTDGSGNDERLPDVRFVWEARNDR